MRKGTAVGMFAPTYGLVLRSCLFFYPLYADRQQHDIILTCNAVDIRDMTEQKKTTNNKCGALASILMLEKFPTRALEKVNLQKIIN